jgi:hypothetical protein
MGGFVQRREATRNEAAARRHVIRHDTCSDRERMNPRAVLRLAGLAAACACIAAVGACGSSGGGDHCLNPQPLPPFCGEPEPLPPSGPSAGDDAGLTNSEGGPDAGAD